MKNLILAAFLLLSICAQSQEFSKRVLFLGNSYTFFNDLPKLYADFSAVGGDTIDVASNTPGGYTLQGHSTNAQSLQLIGQGSWDYVVLQEQSQLPSFPIGQVNTQCFPYAEDLDEEITEANECAETVFFMTWGRKNGDASNCASWPPVCTYQGMDSLLAMRYMQMGDDNEAIVSPVGAVWKYIRANFSGIELYDFDESHPSLAGSYAAACTFYAILNRADPENVAFDGGLNALHSAQIRFAASTVAFDSLSKWYVGNYDTTTIADFNYGQSGMTASFNNTSTNALSQLWDFGDGDTSTVQHPSHTYSTPGTFQVVLTTQHCDSIDTASAYLTFEGDTTDTNNTDSTTTGVPDINTQIQIFPIPTSGLLHVTGIPASSKIAIKVTDILGRPVFVENTQSAKELTLDLSHLPHGNYNLLIGVDGQSIVKPLLLN